MARVTPAADTLPDSKVELSAHSSDDNPVQTETPAEVEAVHALHDQPEAVVTASTVGCCQGCLQRQCSTHKGIPASWDGDDPILRWYSPYGLSSWTYAVTGICLFVGFRDTFSKKPKVVTPVELEAFTIMFQSLCSFCSDQRYLTKVSIWHIFDRCTGFVNVALIFSNVIFISWIERVFYVCMLACGLMFLGLSRRARRDDDIKAFAWWHTWWHVAPPSGFIAWLLYRKLALEDAPRDRTWP